MPEQTSQSAPDQLQKFQDLARELECDEDEEGLDEALRRIARAPDRAARRDDGEPPSR
jgi:hypothetical protein